MSGGPWIFRNVAVVMEEYNGITHVDEYKLDRIPVWARIVGIPDALMKKEIGEKIAKKVGIPPIKVIVNEGRINPTKYFRARVHLMLDTPLVRFVPLTLKESKKYPVEYEKLPNFCDFCGLVGHVVTECGDGIHRPEECEWGDWLLVNYDEPSNGYGTGRGQQRNRVGNYGGGGRFGRGRGNPGDPNPSERNTMDIDAIMPQASGVVVPSARKRLIGHDGSLSRSQDRGVPLKTPPQGFVSEKVGLLENGPEAQVDKSQLSTPRKFQDLKRMRTTTEVVSSAPSSSATPQEGVRRDQ